MTRIEVFQQMDIWWPAYEKLNESMKKDAELRSLPVHIQIEKFIQLNEIKAISITSIGEIIYLLYETKE